MTYPISSTFSWAAASSSASSEPSRPRPAIGDSAVELPRTPPQRREATHPPGAPARARAAFVPPVVDRALAGYAGRPSQAELQHVAQGSSRRLAEALGMGPSAFSSTNTPSFPLSQVRDLPAAPARPRYANQQRPESPSPRRPTRPLGAPRVGARLPDALRFPLAAPRRAQPLQHPMAPNESLLPAAWPEDRASLPR